MQTRYSTVKQLSPESWWDDGKRPGESVVLSEKLGGFRGGTQCAGEIFLDAFGDKEVPRRPKTLPRRLQGTSKTAQDGSKTTHGAAKMPGQADHIDQRFDAVDIAALQRTADQSGIAYSPPPERHRVCAANHRHLSPADRCCGDTSLIRPTSARVLACWPIGRTLMVPSTPISSFSYSGMTIGPASPSTGWPAPVSNWPLILTRRFPCPGIGLTAVRRLHADPAITVHRDVECAAGGLYIALFEAGTLVMSRRKGATLMAGALDDLGLSS